MVWTNIQGVLERYAPILADNYKTLSKIQQVSFRVDNLQIILNLPDYWIYVENGRGPGKFPPLEKISNWITVNNILPRPLGGITPTHNQLTYLISRKIAREGTQGKHALDKTLTELLEGNLVRDIESAAVKDILNKEN